MPLKLFTKICSALFVTLLLFSFAVYFSTAVLTECYLNGSKEIARFLKISKRYTLYLMHVLVQENRRSAEILTFDLVPSAMP